MPVNISFRPTNPSESAARTEAFIVRPQAIPISSKVDQQFDWGHMQWLIEPGRNWIEQIGIGLTIFYVGGVDDAHYHMGSTQVVNILAGFGHHYVNGTRYDFKAGDILYIPPYAHHKMLNDSTETDLVVLGVYIPINEKPFLGKYQPEFCDMGNDDRSLLSLIDVQILQDILNRLSRTLNQSIELINHDGSCLLSSSNQASLCRRMRDTCARHCKQNLLRAIKHISVVDKSDIFMCCGTVASIITPVVSENVIRGFIKCGEFFFNSGDREEMIRYLKSNSEVSEALAKEDIAGLLKNIQIDKRHAVHAAAEDTLSVARFIAEMAVNMANQKAREQARLDMLEARMVEARLKQALQEADLKLLESQLNPHFLFNTLNTIEHLAYLEGSVQVSNLVLSLGKLLRMALGKTRGVITVEEEILLLRGYLDIQKARFGPRLNDVLDVDQAALRCLVPGLTLQPLVENTIIHGVEAHKGHCQVTVRVKRLENNLLIQVEDNGPGLKDKAEGVGLRSVRARLTHYFGSNYIFDLKSRPGGGVLADLVLPANEEASDMAGHGRGAG